MDANQLPKNIDRKHVYVREFESVSALGRYLDTAERHPQAQRSSVCRDNSWAGPALEKTIDNAKHGGRYPKGAENLSPVDVDPDLIDPSIEIYHAPGLDVCGYAPDVPSAIIGVPTNMWAPVEEMERKRLIRVAVNVSVSCAVKVHQIENRGRALLSVIDALTALGYSIEVTAVNGWTDSLPNCTRAGKRAYWDLRTVIKGATDVWDPEAAAFVLANPAYTRRLIFNAMECDPDIWPFTNQCYAYPAEFPTPGFDLSFAGVHSGHEDRSAYDTPDGAIRAVMNRFTRYLKDTQA